MGSEIIVTPVVRIFPEWQQILIVVVGAVSGALSIVGSGLILYSILVDWERKKKEVKYRFLFGLSISDIITSLVFVAWPLPIPEGTPNVWGAMGTTQTCTLQGFLLQLSAIGVFYNGALCHWFYYSICKGMSDAVYIQKGWERNWHIFNISFAFVTACIITAVDQFNYQIMGCWISNYPYGCEHFDDIECIRGGRWAMYAWLFMGAPLVVMLGVVGVYMYRIYRYVNDVLGKAQKQILRTSTTASGTGAAGTVSGGRTVPENQTLSGRNSGDSVPLQDESSAGLGVNSDEFSSAFGSRVSRNDSVNAQANKSRTSMTSSGNNGKDSIPHEEKPADPPLISDESSSNVGSKVSRTDSVGAQTNKSRKSIREKLVDFSKRESARSMGLFGGDPSHHLSGALQKSYNRMEARKSEAAKQSFWYLFIFLVTHQWNLFLGILDMAAVSQPFWLPFLAQLFWPSQGFANMFVFVRTRVATLRKAHPNVNYFLLVYWSIMYFDESKQALRTIDLPTHVKKRIMGDEGAEAGPFPAVSSLANPSCFREEDVVHKQEESNILTIPQSAAAEDTSDDKAAIAAPNESELDSRNLVMQDVSSGLDMFHDKEGGFGHTEEIIAAADDPPPFGSKETGNE